MLSGMMDKTGRRGIGTIFGIDRDGDMQEMTCDCPAEKFFLILVPRLEFDCILPILRTFKTRTTRNISS